MSKSISMLIYRTCWSTISLVRLFALLYCFEMAISLKNLPPPMRSNQPGTWSYDTMSRRIADDILPRIIENNADILTQPDMPSLAETFLQLNDLKSSILVQIE